MKVLFSGHSINHYNIGLGSALSKMVKLYTIYNKKLDVPSRGITVPNIRRSNLPGLLSLAFLSRFLNFDIVHVNNSVQGAFTKTYDKLIVTEHGSPTPQNVKDSTKEFYKEERIKLMELYQIDVPIVTISKYSALKLRKDLGINVYKYIYHGLLNDFQVDRPKEFSKKNSPVILWVSRLVEEKEPMIFLKAIRILKNKLNFKVHIVGNGPFKQYMRRFIVKYGLEKDVIFLEPIPFKNMPLLYNSGTIFVHTNRREAFGLAVLEAMGMGLPVIVPNEGGAQEVAGDAGIAFNAGDYRDLAEKILEVLDDEELYYKYSTKSIERSKFFAWEKAAKEYMEVYKKVGG